MFKRLAALVMTFAMIASVFTGVVFAAPANAAEEDEHGMVDPETVMWTNRMIEDVLAETGKYKTVKEVNPNESNKDSATSTIQTPYGKPGEKYTSWAYSEFIWTNFYPIGNGRMAGMVAGGIDNEVIQINEDTCWDGSPYAELKDENGNDVNTLAASHAAKSITSVDQTGGSIKDNWKYYRGADASGKPAAIGSADAVVGDETFRAQFPDFAGKSISNQALAVDNARTDEAVQQRYSLESMVEAKFLGNPTGQRAYKSFAEVYLDFGHKSADASNYTKSLDMKTGIVTVEYDHAGKHYKRESFASYPDQVVVTHVESDAELDFSAQLHSYHNEKDGYFSYEKISDNEVKLKAAVTNGNKDNNIGRINVINFEARMLLQGDGAFSVSEDNSTVSVRGGREATIYVVGATNYVDYLTLDSSKPERDCQYYMDNVKSKSYDLIKSRHLADFTPQFEKSSLSLANKDGNDFSNIPTEQRVRKNLSSGASGYTVGTRNTLSDAKKVGVTSTYSEGDNQLAVLMFNYGKYLILAGSRDGREASGEGEINIPESQPLNLTGKWNAAMSAGWNGKYTININTEMNYWAAQPLSIGESERPLIDTFKELAQSGSITADYQYGIGDSSTYKPGDPWVMHHNYDLWRGTQPIDNATAGLWPTGGAWLLDHAWQYYQYNKDTEYLAEVYPYMVGAAKFFTQFLIVDPKTGYLITAASCSPEQGGVQPGPAMDTQLVRNLYDMVQQASKILGKESENAELLAKIAEQMPSSYLADEKGKIAPSVIDKSGYISEWVRGDVSFDLSENKNPEAEKHKNIINPFTGTAVSIKEHDANNHGGHRHCSHLWELYPGTHINAYSDDAGEQKLFKAFQKTVSAKGVGDRSWAYAWRIALNARALQGKAANTSLETLITTKTSPNLLTQHPNFQVDGNYGTTAAIIEMLIQSHDDAITLLPAIPAAWASGSFSGINTRKGAVIDLTWDGGIPTSTIVHATETGNVSLRNEAVMAGASVTDESGSPVGVSLNADNSVATFPVEAGKTYTVTYSGGTIQDSEKTYVPTDVKEFYASDGASKPKLANENTEVGYLYRKDGVKVGYAYEDVSLDGLYGITLKMPKVRNSNTYVSVVIDDPSGKEIANQLISTGDNELALKNTDGLSGKHKLYFIYYQDPFDSASIDKYLGNAGDVIVYCKGSAPASSYKIDKAQFNNETGNLEVALSYSGSEAAPKAKLIVAAYDKKDNQILLDQAMFDVEGTAIKNLSYVYADGTDVKVYVWDGTGSIMPLAEAKNVAAPVIVKPSAVPTALPTTVPTTLPTAAPTTAPTTDPALKGVYIGATKYNTVAEAVAAAEAMNPSSEETRVTIDLMPGVYREQVRVTKPYITIQKKPGTVGEAKLTWYYGLGSMYDSCNSSGYYDPSVIGDGECYGPKDWGPSLKVDKGATAFVAKDIYLENSYNAYYTEEELTDIVKVDPDTNNSNFPRADWIKAQKASGINDDKINAYLQSRKDITFNGKNVGSPRERCAALHCSADRAQFINCTVMSTQDTIGINSNRMYFKNCKLGGTTDYICGSATAVFDGCELYTNSGPMQGESATLTAASNTKETEGYLFWNCRITGSDNATAGSLGRPWGLAPGPAAHYINTTIGKNLIGPSGWSDMSGNKAADARFGEYGSVDTNGNAVDMSRRIDGKVLDEWTMLRYNPYTFTKGNDGWDPAGAASLYADIDKIINNAVIDTSDGTTNIVSLPAAPSGYEFKWESSSEFAEVSSDGTKLTLIRPANGEQPIDAGVKLYVREAGNKSIGAEKTIGFAIQPTQDTTNVFAVSGSIKLSVASEEAQSVKIVFRRGKAVIKTVDVEVPANATAQTYRAENIPVGSYTVSAETSNSEYNIVTAVTDITGVKGEDKTFDVEAKKMTTILASDGNFDSFVPSVTGKDGFTAGAYTVSGAETAALGAAGEKVYKLSKADGKKLDNKTGISFDLTKLLQSGTTLKNTKTIKFSFDFLMESIDLMPADYSYMDLATSTSNAGADKADKTRIVRWGVHNGWKQINMFNAANARINGDNTQFNKNRTMANKWYRIEGVIDLDAATIYSTLYDRDNDMYILNKKAFVIAEPQKDGTNPGYPQDLDLSSLYFNFYMDKNGKTTHAMEYYIDNISLEYQDFE